MRFPFALLPLVALLHGVAAASRFPPPEPAWIGTPPAQVRKVTVRWSWHACTQGMVRTIDWTRRGDVFVASLDESVTWDFQERVERRRLDATVPAALVDSLVGRMEWTVPLHRLPGRLGLDDATLRLRRAEPLSRAIASSLLEPPPLPPDLADLLASPEAVRTALLAQFQDPGEPTLGGGTRLAVVFEGSHRAELTATPGAPLMLPWTIDLGDSQGRSFDPDLGDAMRPLLADMEVAAALDVQAYQGSGFWQDGSVWGETVQRPLEFWLLQKAAEARPGWPEATQAFLPVRGWVAPGCGGEAPTARLYLRRRGGAYTLLVDTPVSDRRLAGDWWPAVAEVPALDALFRRHAWLASWQSAAPDRQIVVETDPRGMQSWSEAGMPGQARWRLRLGSSLGHGMEEAWLLAAPSEDDVLLLFGDPLPPPGREDFATRRVTPDGMVRP